MSALQVVLHPKLPPGVADVVRGVSHLVVHAPTDDDGVARALDAGGEVLVTYTWRDDFLSGSLRWVAGCGAGFEQYPLAKFADRGVVLTSAAGVHADCVAEHAFALLLALTRRIGEAARNMTQRRWVALPGEELGGKKLAIVGLGRIGEGIVRRAGGWGMQIVGVKRKPTDYRGSVADVRGADRIAEVCEWADIVVLSAPATPDRRPLIGATELQRLGAGWIVNVGRGSLIDEAALVDALQRGTLRGAGLDVAAVEPLPADSPLWVHPKVVLTAHNAGDSPGFGPRWGEIFRANLVALAGQGDWRNRIAGYGVAL
jgi:phosphoglycerate dehydrogenase-like enzyme